MDTNDTPAPASAQTIRVIDINPLLTGDIHTTVGHVSAVLHLLTFLNMTECEVDDEFASGLALMHRLINRTLIFASDYPDTDRAMPIKHTVTAGGAS